MTSEFLPLGRVSANDIRSVQESGLMLPIREQDPPLLVTSAGGGTTTIILSGGRAFSYFTANLKSPHYGLFLPDVEIVVDFSSATTAGALIQTSGVLILDQTSLAIVAKPNGDEYADPQLVPLWTTVEQGAEAARVAFPRWGVAHCDEERRTILFEHEYSRTA
jgi:hypothetical protein